jgi:hypothetical protein
MIKMVIRSDKKQGMSRAVTHLEEGSPEVGNPAEGRDMLYRPS